MVVLTHSISSFWLVALGSLWRSLWQGVMAAMYLLWWSLWRSNDRMNCWMNSKTWCFPGFQGETSLCLRIGARYWFIFRLVFSGCGFETNIKKCRIPVSAYTNLAKSHIMVCISSSLGQNYIKTQNFGLPKTLQSTWHTFAALLRFHECTAKWEQVARSFKW